MTACKHIASMGAAATGEAYRKSAAKSDGAEERKPSVKCRKGKKPKGKLAVKSNGAEKTKTHDLYDVTRGLAVMSIAQEKSEYEELALFAYRNTFWMENFKGLCDKASVRAIFKIADENWKLFNDSDKAPYLAIARVNKVILAQAADFRKTLKVTRTMTNKMMNLKM